MAPILTIEDLRERHRRFTPTMFYDYADSGSYTEGTYRENETAFAAIKLRQRVARNIDRRALSSTILGEPTALPVYLAPVGMVGMQHPDGELHAARAAEKFGVPFTLSTMSIASIEDVAAATDKPFYFQLYVMRDRGFVEELIGRARAAGCSALVLTLDLQILGQRHKDLRNGLSAPPKMTPQVVADLMRHPRWCLAMLGTKRRTFGNIVGHVKGIDDMSSLTEWTHRQFDPTLDWSSVDWIKSKWDGKLILKGIGDVEDARIAVETGADAITVSNHGGRQLDGAPASIHMLPEIAEAVGDRIEVHMDGGIRSGQDVMKALALGAHATSIGRAYVHGVGAMGEAGVTRALEIIARELDITMALAGETDVANVGTHNVWGGVPRAAPIVEEPRERELVAVGA
ncbi:alpha-hydroxy acid oxidase [Acuticoccus sp.]|uniref:alpha-hydroxy acid oxidase n=1 Tax=Acuticoccus sp. TaxID=1904378 RepID=UPI003B52CF9F